MLHLHRAERADALVGALARLLGEPPQDPMTPEVVAVPTRGIERWIAQELSARLGATPGRADGVSANIGFPFPGRVVGGALAEVHGIDPAEDPWRPERLVWPLLELVDAHLAEAWLAPLRAHLSGPDGAADPTRMARRYGAVRHIADLYDRYAVHRPTMLDAWRDGADLDAAGRPLPHDAAWQAELWRRAVARVAVPDPAARLGAGVAALRDGAPVDLPDRLSLFGMTALPASYVDVLAALALHRDVHLFLLHPSPRLWERIAAVEPSRHPALRRDDDVTRRVPRSPLLASWGRDAREMQLVVGRAGFVQHVHTVQTDPPATLLHRLQAGVRADEPPPRPPLDPEQDERPPLGARDRSVQVHACHGRTRQVEVLRDAILHLLADDPGLEPRDIIVMCPDIETFAPIVSAVFSAHGADPGDGPGGSGTGAGGGAHALPDLRVQLADRAIRSTNPVLRAVAELLALASGRLTATEVLDFAAREPVRRRFRLDDDGLAQIGAWVTDARVRWGLDGEHRAAFGLPGVAANSWRAGLDRVLLGVAMADEGDRLVGGAVPLDDVEGTEVQLAGRLAELVDRLRVAMTNLAGPHTAERWRDAIAASAEALTATGEAERWQRLQVHRVLDDMVREARNGGAVSPAELSLPEVRALLEDRLAGRPTRANHRTGDLTVCTLVPMRSVPHRVVCLLGMDDGTFPRKLSADGDDLIDRDPHVGDRDPRTEDRQLLLDALLAAGDALVVTYTGRHERTNEHLPPAVPIGELLDVIDRTVHGEDGRPARDQIRTEHPLQASDPRGFRPRELHPDRPWSFDGVALAGAVARGRSQAAPAFLMERLPALDSDTIALDDLARFVEHPARAFLRQRLGVHLARPGDQAGESIPVALPPLDEHAIGERLLAARMADTDTAGWIAAERARGVLPPGALADSEIERVAERVDALLAVAAERLDTDGNADALEVDVPLAAGRSLLGTVPGVVAGQVQFIRYGRLKPRYRLQAWVRLLAAAAAHPETTTGAASVGRTPFSGKEGVRVARIDLPAGLSAGDLRSWALGHLDCLADLYDRGLREPLPIPCTTAAAYVDTIKANAGLAPHKQRNPEAEALRAWTTEWTYPNEDSDPEHLLVYSEQLPFERLLAFEPADDEAGGGWDAAETTRFGRCARRLWQGLLDHETVEDVKP